MAATTTTYSPAIDYDARNKIWSGPPEQTQFAADLSIGEIIFDEMQRQPAGIAQISVTEHTTLTREQLLQNALHVASYMRRMGLQQTQVVGIMARNTTHLSAVVYACCFNGIAFHALNVAYEQQRIADLYQLTQPRLIFCDGDEYERLKAATATLQTQIVTMRKHRSGVTTIEQLLATPIEHNFRPARLQQGNDQTLAILCSSGTTGTPKAVTISNSYKLFNFFQASTRDVMHSHSTLDWVSGLLTIVASGVYSTKRIIADCSFDAALLLRLVAEHKVNWLLQTPTQMAMLVNCPEFEHADLSSLTCYIYTGSSCSAAVQQAIRSRLSVDCQHFAYGCTELGCIATLNLHYDQKPNSVGRPVNGIRLKVLNEQGAALAANQLGEICLYNGQRWAGYYGNAAETHKIHDAQQWFHTGDLGYVDNDGFLYIVDRKKDMLKYQNCMYYPKELEDIICQMPDVSEVCVFGVPREINGDEAAAAVVAKIGVTLQAQQVVDFVAQHITAKYKQLNAGAIIVPELKLSANGKVNRVANKNYFMQLMGISVV